MTPPRGNILVRRSCFHLGSAFGMAMLVAASAPEAVELRGTARWTPGPLPFSRSRPVESPGRAATASVGTPTNQPIDTNGDGRSDFVIVDGDYNGDTVVNVQDIQDAARALTALDSEAKEIEVVGSHVYGVAGMPPPPILSRYDLLELDSNTTLECSPEPVLEGYDETVSGPNGHVIGNRDIVNGNSGITIRGCTIDGGQPTATHHTPLWFRTAVYFDGCDDCSIEHSILRNTLHSCFYTRHGEVNFSLRNRYENCGGTFVDLPAYTQGLPCIYVFANSGRTTRGVYSSGDRMFGCGAPAFNVRRADRTASISDIAFLNAVVEDIVVRARGIYWSCFNVRGSSSDNLVFGITCRRTAGFATGSGGLAAGGYDHEDAAQNLWIARIVHEEMQREITIGPWSTNVVVSGVQVVSSSGAALAIRPPNRGFIFERSTLCGASGAVVFDSAGGVEAAVDPDDPEETTTIRDTDVLCSDGDPLDGLTYDGIEVRGGSFQKLTLDNVDVSGITRDAVRVHNPPGVLEGVFEVSIAGGSFEGVVRAEADALLRISGGLLERIVVWDQATIELFGQGFVAEEDGNPVLVGFGDIVDGFDGRITGTLADGSPVDITALNGTGGSRILLRAAPVGVPTLSGAALGVLAALLAVVAHRVLRPVASPKPPARGSRPLPSQRRAH